MEVMGGEGERKGEVGLWPVGSWEGRRDSEEMERKGREYSNLTY